VAAPRNVINLMDALRASIAADTKKPKAASKRAGDSVTPEKADPKSRPQDIPFPVPSNARPQ
jgi:hypothetical protein